MYIYSMYDTTGVVSKVQARSQTAQGNAKGIHVDVNERDAICVDNAFEKEKGGG